MFFKKRPMLLTAAICLPLFAIISLFDLNIALFAAAFFAAAFIVSLFFVKRKALAVFFSVLALVLAVSSLCTSLLKAESKRASGLYGEVFNLSATVLTAPVYENQTVSFKISDPSLSFGIIEAQSTDISLLSLVSVGDRIECEALIIAASKSDLCELVFLKCLILNAPAVTEENAYPVLKAISLVRKNLTDSLTEAVGGENGILASAMLTGKGSSGTESIDYFRTAGISHYFAVSGFHVSVFTASLFFVIRAFGASKRLAVFLSLPVLLFTVIFADFSPSVIRAAVMCFIVIVAETSQKSRSLLNTLAFTAVAVTLFNPYLLFSPSFLLSYSAVLGISVSQKALYAVVGRFFKGYFRQKRAHAVLSPVFVSFFAALFTAPASLIFFGYLPLYSVLANLLTSFAVSLAFSLILLFSVLLFLPFLPFILGKAISALISLVTLIASDVSALPYSRLFISAEEAVALSITVFAAMLVIFCVKKKRLVFLSATVAAVTFIFAFAAVLWGNGKSKLTISYTSGVKAVSVLTKGESLVYLFEKPDKPSVISEIIFSHGLYGNPVTVVNGEDMPPAEISFENAEIGFFQKEDEFSALILGKNQNIALFPSGFSPNELYKTAFYDIIICEGSLNNLWLLPHSGAKSLYTFEYSLYKKNLLEEKCNELGTDFSAVSYGDKIVIYFE